MNSCNFIGRFVKDPVLNVTKTQKKVVGYTLAVQRTYKNSNGEYEADFIDCISWENQAELIVAHFKKGDLIGVTGRTETRINEYNGFKSKRSDLVVERITFCERKKDSMNNKLNNNNDETGHVHPSDYFEDLSNDKILNGLDISDDELPF